MVAADYWTRHADAPPSARPPLPLISGGSGIAIVQSGAVEKASATSDTLVIGTGGPTGLTTTPTADDLLVVWAVVNQGTATTVNAPTIGGSAMTLIGERTNNGNLSVHAYQKKLVSGDISGGAVTVTWTKTVNRIMHFGAFQVSGQDATVAFSDVGTSGAKVLTNASGSPRNAHPTATTTVGVSAGDLLVALIGVKAGNTQVQSSTGESPASWDTFAEFHPTSTGSAKVGSALLTYLTSSGFNAAVAQTDTTAGGGTAQDASLIFAVHTATVLASPPSAPGPITWPDVQNNEMTFAWTAAAAGSDPIDHYNVYWADAGHGDADALLTTVAAGDTLSVRVTSLLNYWNYRATVEAVDTTGRVGAQVTSTHRTDHGANKTIVGAGTLGLGPRLAFGQPKLVQKIKGLGGIAPRLAFGIPKVKLPVIGAGGIAPRLAFGRPQVVSWGPGARYDRPTATSAATTINAPVSNTRFTAAVVTIGADVSIDRCAFDGRVVFSGPGAASALLTDSFIDYAGATLDTGPLQVNGAASLHARYCTIAGFKSVGPIIATTGTVLLEFIKDRPYQPAAPGPPAPQTVHQAGGIAPRLAFGEPAVAIAGVAVHGAGGIPPRLHFGTIRSVRNEEPAPPVGAYGPRLGHECTGTPEPGGLFTTSQTLTNRHFTTLVTINGLEGAPITAAIDSCRFEGGLVCNYVGLSGRDNQVDAGVPLRLFKCTGSLDDGLVDEAVAGAVVIDGGSSCSLSRWTARPAAGHEATVGIDVKAANGARLLAWDVQGFTAAALQLNGTTPSEVLNVLLDQDASANRPIIGGTVRLWRSKDSGVCNSVFKGDAPNAFDLGSTDPRSVLCVAPICLFNEAENEKAYTFGSVTRMMRHVVDLGHDLPLYFSPYTEHVVGPIGLTTGLNPVVTSGRLKYDTDGVTLISEATAHGLVTGDVVRPRNMSMISGGTTFSVTVLSSTTFRLEGATASSGISATASGAAPWPDLIVTTFAPSSLAARGYLRIGRHPLGVRPTDDSAHWAPTTGLPAGCTVTIGTNGKITWKNTSSTPVVFEDCVFSHDGFVAKGVTGSVSQMQHKNAIFDGNFSFRRCWFYNVAPMVKVNRPGIIDHRDCWFSASNMARGATMAWSDKDSAWFTKHPTTPFWDGKVLATDKFITMGDGTSWTFERCWLAYTHDDAIQPGAPLCHLYSMTFTTGEALGTPAHGPHEDMHSLGGSVGSGATQPGYVEWNTQVHHGGHGVYWTVASPSGPGHFIVRDCDAENQHYPIPGCPYVGGGEDGGLMFGMGNLGPPPNPPSPLDYTFDNVRWSARTASSPIATEMSFSGLLEAINCFWIDTATGHTAGDQIAVVDLGGGMKTLA